MMKSSARKSKLIALVLAAVMVTSFAFAGCDDTTEQKPQEQPKPVTVVVEFDRMGGSGTASLREVEVGKTYGELPTVTKTGYTFDGWWTENFASEVKADTTVTATEKHTLYAKWTAIESTVTLNPAGGNVTPMSVRVSYDGVYGNLPTPTLTGHTFASWRTAANGEGDAVTAETKVTATQDHTLYADYTANVYPLVFDLGDGNWADGAQEKFAGKTVTYGAEYGLLPVAADVILAERAFGGWWTENTYEHKVFKTTAVAHAAQTNTEHTLYAKWLAASEAFTVKFVTGNGTSLADIYVEEGEAYGDLPVLTKTGYAFGGWFTQEDGAGEEVTAQTKAGTAGTTATIYAKWTAGETTVTLSANYGAEPATSEITATYDSPMPAESVITRTGYVFGGYYDNAACTGTQYYTADMASARNWDKTDSAVTLYAKWTAKTTVLTLDLNYDGAPQAAAVTATYDSKLPTPQYATRNGYFFCGYYDNADAAQGNMIYDADLTSDAVWNGEAETMTLYAAWRKGLTIADGDEALFKANEFGEPQFEIVTRTDGKKWLKVTAPDVEINEKQDCYIVDFVMKAPLHQPSTVLTTLDLEYDEDLTVSVGEDDIKSSGNRVEAVVNAGDDYLQNWSSHGAGMGGKTWQAASIKYIPHSTIANKPLKWCVRVNKNVDMSKFAIYVSDIELFLPDESKTVWDFTDARDAEYFVKGGDSRGTIDFAVGGTDDKYLELKYTHTGSNTPLMHFMLNRPVKAGSTVRFDFEPIYTGEGDVMVADADKSQEVTNGIEVEVFTDWWGGEWFSRTQLQVGSAWNSKCRVSITPTNGSQQGAPMNMGVYVKMNAGFDFTKLSFRISDVRIFEPDTDKTSWDFTDEFDALYFSRGGDSNGAVNFAIGGTDSKYLEITYLPSGTVTEAACYFVLNRPVPNGASVSFDIEPIYEGGSLIVPNVNAAKDTANGMHLVAFGANPTNASDQDWSNGLWWTTAHLTVGNAWAKTTVTYTATGERNMVVGITLHPEIDFTKLVLRISNVRIINAA